MFWSRSFIDERSFCQSFSRICLAMYQLCTTAAEHVGDASLWAGVRASTLRRYVWVCAVHSVGLTPLMQSGTRVPKRLSHDSPIVWGWVACGQNAQWWDAVWHREENEERGKKICGRSEVIEMRLPERSYLCCVSDHLSGLSSRKTQACREFVFHYHKETFTLNEYLQTVSSLGVFQGSFICHSARWNEGCRPWVLHKVQRMSWRVISSQLQLK